MYKDWIVFLPGKRTSFLWTVRCWRTCTVNLLVNIGSPTAKYSLHKISSNSFGIIYGIDNHCFWTCFQQQSASFIIWRLTIRAGSKKDFVLMQCGNWVSGDALVLQSVYSLALAKRIMQIGILLSQGTLHYKLSINFQLFSLTACLVLAFGVEFHKSLYCVCVVVRRGRWVPLTQTGEQPISHHIKR